MIEWIRQWLLSVTGAAILAALAESLMPSGPVRQVGRLSCGLVLLAALLSPVLQWQTGDSAALAQWQETLALETQALEDSRQSQLKTIIAQQYAAYAVDKGAELGVSCTATFTCALGEDGLFYPTSGTIYGDCTPAQTEALQDALAADLALDASQIIIMGGNGT